MPLPEIEQYETCWQRRKLYTGGFESSPEPPLRGSWTTYPGMTQTALSGVPEARRRMMAAVRSANTKPEIAVRRMLHRLGYRFRLHGRELPGRPDIVFPKRRSVIEVRGCFWHQHVGCARAETPATRQEFWLPKLAANVSRDIRNASALEVSGWSMLVIWECEIKRVSEMEARLRDFLGPTLNNRVPR